MQELTKKEELNKLSLSDKEIEMNLKQEITRTENLETKLAKGITNINNVIVRGGVYNLQV